jgi:hypothetical protein
MFREVGTGFFCYNVIPLFENCCSTFLFTTRYKRLAEGGLEGRVGWGFFLMEDFDWLQLTLLLAVCLHQSSFLHQELYT